MGERNPIPLGMIAFSDYAIDARVIRLAETAARNGYSVDLLTPRKRGAESRETVNRVNLYRLAVRPYEGPAAGGYVLAYLNFFVQCFLLISLLHLRKRYKIVHVHNMPDFLVFSTVLARILGARIILDIHDPMPETYLAKFPARKKGFLYDVLLLQERLSAAYATRVLTVHEPLKRDVLVKDGIRPDKISVVANFPDDEIFLPSDRFTGSRPLRILYYGTLDDRFGLEDALESLALIKARDSLYFKIVGKGDSQDSIREKIRELGLGPSVSFENTLYPLRQIPMLAAPFHLGLVPYKPGPATRYMLPVKFVEMIAMGLPAITVANVPIRHYFDENMYFAYNPESKTSLADVVCRIIDHPELLLEKREAILRNRGRYLWTGEGRKYLEVLNQLAEARKA